MSNIYIQEPLTSGKVLLHTTVGDIDIELWSKEAPKACRNFIQLCLEGYYDGTIFHRVVKGFIVQGGDPTGTGTGGESIYGQPFKDEFHSRLRFVRRGLVAMANSGKDDNESQFFFTLGATPELQNKHTVFGKITGDTLYNILKFEDGLVDSDDRPIYPHKIISCQVLSNPFPDIEPRTKKEEDVKAEKPKEKVKKNFKLLSFGEEAEEDEAEVNAVNEAYKGQSKSSHDLANDAKLSSVPAISFDDQNASTLEKVRKKFENTSSKKDTSSVKESKDLEKDDIKKEENDQKDAEENKRKEIQRQIKELKKELKKKPTQNMNDLPEKPAPDNPEEDGNKVLMDYHEKINDYQQKANQIPKKGTSDREMQTIKFLEKFKSSMHNAISNSQEDELEEDDDDDSCAWMVHCLRSNEVKVVLAKDANIPSVDRYDIADPRNPITERRRNEKRHKK